MYLNREVLEVIESDFAKNKKAVRSNAYLIKTQSKGIFLYVVREMHFRTIF